MPYLSPDDRAQLLGVTANICRGCGAFQLRNYCRSCDEFFFECRCPPSGSAALDRTSQHGHVGHRTY